MTERRPSPSPKERKAAFWVGMALSVRAGIVMHQVSEQMTKTPGTQERPWGNVTEHCLVERARVEVLGKWIGLPDTIITEMKVGALLHDFSKKQEIEVTREANSSGNSPLAAVNTEHKESENLLKEFHFNDRVIRLASSPGGLAPQLIEAQRILDKPVLTDDDWAYLIVHYVDDCSIGSDWVRPSQTDPTGKQTNIIDFRNEDNKAKTVYSRISQEVGEQLRESIFEGMNSLDAISVISHEIERRLSKKIFEQTGELINPLLIPEIVDQRIKQRIENTN